MSGSSRCSPTLSAWRRYESHPFTFDGQSVCVISDDRGEPSFNANEICDVPAFGNHRQAIDSHVDDDDVHKLDAIDNLRRTQHAYHVNKSGQRSMMRLRSFTL